MTIHSAPAFYTVRNELLEVVYVISLSRLTGPLIPSRSRPVSTSLQFEKKYLAEIGSCETSTVEFEVI